MFTIYNYAYRDKTDDNVLLVNDLSADRVGCNIRELKASDDDSWEDASDEDSGLAAIIALIKQENGIKSKENGALDDPLSLETIDKQFQVGRD